MCEPHGGISRKSLVLKSFASLEVTINQTTWMTHTHTHTRIALTGCLLRQTVEECIHCGVQVFGVLGGEMGRKAEGREREDPVSHTHTCPDVC